MKHSSKNSRKELLKLTSAGYIPDKEPMADMAYWQLVLTQSWHIGSLIKPLWVQFQKKHGSSTDAIIQSALTLRTFTSVLLLTTLGIWLCVEGVQLVREMETQSSLGKKLVKYDPSKKSSHKLRSLKGSEPFNQLSQEYLETKHGGYKHELEDKYVQIIITEASGEGEVGMLGVAECLRNRGWNTRGFTGLLRRERDRFVDDQGSRVKSIAYRCIRTALAGSDTIAGATHFESADFPTPWWTSEMKLVATVGKHQFWNEK